MVSNMKKMKAATAKQAINKNKNGSNGQAKMDRTSADSQTKKANDASKLTKL